MDFYQAGLDAYAGERELWAEKMVEVIAGSRSNPYYSWFLVGTSEDKVGGASLPSTSDETARQENAKTQETRRSRAQ